MIDIELPVVSERQPDYTSCGPTILHAIDLTAALLGRVLGEGTTLIAGVDGTHLHPCIRETEQGPDDVKGDGSDDGNRLRIRPKDGQARRAERAS